MLGDEMKNLLEARIKASPPRISLFRMLKLAGVKARIHPFFGINTIKPSIAGGHHQERIPVDESLQDKWVVRPAILIIIEIFRQDGTRVENLRIGSLGGGKDMNTENVNVF